eukprot:gene27190-biopygen7231
MDDLVVDDIDDFEDECTVTASFPTAAGMSSIHLSEV